LRIITPRGRFDRWTPLSTSIQAAMRTERVIISPSSRVRIRSPGMGIRCGQVRRPAPRNRRPRVAMTGPSRRYWGRNRKAGR
jgi:hypothetical protein